MHIFPYLQRVINERLLWERINVDEISTFGLTVAVGRVPVTRMIESKFKATINVLYKVVILW